MTSSFPQSAKSKQNQSNSAVTMPKIVDPLALIVEFGGKGVWSYNATTKSLFCKLCSTSCTTTCRSNIAQHVETKRHKEKLKVQKQGKGTIQQMLTEVVTVDTASTFAKDLATMMVGCDIPFNKVENPAFQAFI